MKRLLALLVISGVVIAVAIGCGSGTSSTLPLNQTLVSSSGAVASLSGSSSGSSASSWACTVNVSQSGTTGVLNGPGKCGLGAVPMGAQACVVTPPTGGSPTTGWCEATASSASVAGGSAAAPAASTGSAGAQPTSTTPPAQTVAAGAPTFQNCYNGGIPNAAYCGQVSTSIPYFQNCYGNCPGNVNPTALVKYVKPPAVGFHEFQTNCPIFQHTPDDPIVHFGQPGASHMHSFFGNTSANAFTTLATLQANAGTTCATPGDHAAYWMPTLYSFAGAAGQDVPAMPAMPVIPANATIVDPLNHLGANGSTIVYYKAGTSNYTAVVPFPPGFRMVVGSPLNTLAASFHGFYSCTPGVTSLEFPASCPPGNTLIVRLEAPSCWDGVNLDSPHHNTHVVYPTNDSCPLDHPVFLPMLQFKIPFIVNGVNMSTLLFSSGGPYTFHYDFFNDWDPAALQALVTHCINGGRQCNAQGVGAASNP